MHPAHCPPPYPAACKVTPPSSQLPHLGKFSNPSSGTSLTQSPRGQCGRVDNVEAKGVSITHQPRLMLTVVCSESTKKGKEWGGAQEDGRQGLGEAGFVI